MLLKGESKYFKACYSDFLQNCIFFARINDPIKTESYSKKKTFLPALLLIVESIQLLNSDTLVYTPGLPGWAHPIPKLVIPSRM